MSKKKYHLATLASGWIERIFDGSKTIESRFSETRCLPFRKVDTGDVVYMRESNGLVKGMFTVSKVETFENLTKRQVLDIKTNYAEAILGFPRESEEWLRWRISGVLGAIWEKWLAAKQATLIHISDPIAFNAPFVFQKKIERAWGILEAPIE